MVQMNIVNNSATTTVVNVKESDKFSKRVHLQLMEEIDGIGTQSKVEYFMSPLQMQNLGEFLIEQARIIAQSQGDAL